MDQDRLTRKFPIGALQPGCPTAMIVALIINKSDPRRIIGKKDGRERWVTTFTLRDSAVDIINLTVWSCREEALSLKQNFHIGEVVELVRPRILQRVAGARDSQYSPVVTSWLSLVFVDGKSMLAPYLGDPSPFQPLLRLPTKGASAFLSVHDILTNQALTGHYVDILAVVRSVGAEKVFPARDGDLGDKIYREVRLFDQTGDCLILKLWDSELIQLSSEWIPREHVLFLADVRIDWDKYRGSACVVTNSRTVITVNPDTKEVEGLLRHAQLVDFSTVSRLDQFVTSLDPGQVTRVANVTMVEEMLAAGGTSKDSSLTAVKVYGYITRFDIDCPEAVFLHCGCCSLVLRQDSNSGDFLCLNMECGDFSKRRHERSSPSMKYGARADLSDETGTITGVKMSQAMLETRLGPPGEFIKLSDMTRTGYKWSVMLRPLKVTLAMVLPTSESRAGHCMVVDLKPSTLEEITVKMPSPP